MPVKEMIIGRWLCSRKKINSIEINENSQGPFSTILGGLTAFFKLQIKLGNSVYTAFFNKLTPLSTLKTQL